MTGISEELLINFQNEYCLYNEGSSHIEYAQFFEKYFQEPGLEEAVAKPYSADMENDRQFEKIDMNELVQRVSSQF